MPYVGASYSRFAREIRAGNQKFCACSSSTMHLDLPGVDPVIPVEDLKTKLQYKHEQANAADINGTFWSSFWELVQNFFQPIHS